MAVDDLLVLYDLDPAPVLAPVGLADCVLEFHRHAFPPLRIADQEMLTRVPALGRDPSRMRGRKVEGLRIDIDDNVAVVMRARGEQLEGKYVYADGSPFGGFGGALPTRRRLAPHLWILDWLRGRRGSGRVDYAVHRDRP